ncbi:Small ribosomal subunit biogenesis GTPase RsgA [Eubacterium plexicaudatum ASF492]|uniref:Small ribosomal subunit biogenesis GTPase RsgA n=1 Tax=Eubacterium plexicaudatum ASF492 TaxID=1235802 RepID=N2B807_9FIRM|nr:Small ribosomal subunit biogenesis GTPase RsgA [Eubacterium plexicaudatum ASF492]
MQGKILKGISGFYYVHIAESGIYECRAKGVFRQQKMKPLTGDLVEIAVINEAEKTGNVEKILPRKNELFRPAVANIDMALVIFAAASPQPNLNLLDRFLIRMRMQHMPVTICFNKMELLTEQQRTGLAQIYEGCGCPVLFTSAKYKEGMDTLRQALAGKTVAASGPSGVGKSSLINLLQPQALMETGEISRKIERGKQTTRHTQLIHIEGNSYIMDTPGFSSLFLPDMEKEELQQYYMEFAQYEPQCRFQGCSHISEPDCGVKDALAAGRIHPIRYENYKLLYEELKSRRKY